MHLQKNDVIGKIHRWKSIGALVITGYGLLVYSAISLDGWLKRRRSEKHAENEE